MQPKQRDPRWPEIHLYYDYTGRLVAHGELPKAIRCRSRKRFIKLIMAMGMDRNEANTIANTVKNAYLLNLNPRYRLTYQLLYLQFFLSLFESRMKWGR